MNKKKGKRNQEKIKKKKEKTKQQCQQSEICLNILDIF